jgi:hypothetical protein
MFVVCARNEYNERLISMATELGVCQDTQLDVLESSQQLQANNRSDGDGDGDGGVAAMTT